MNTGTSTDGGFGGRRYDLDWVRIGAFMLLILYHVGMYYVTWDWHVKSPNASTAIEPLMMLASPWRLALLFLVSGVATAYLLARQGAGNFFGQRSFRLLVPLVFGMAVIVPPQSYLEVVEKVGYTGSYAEFWRLYITGFHGFCRGTDCLIMPTWNHLWFVAYLWVYTLATYLIVRAVPRVVPALRAVAERRLAGLGLLLIPAAYLAIARLGLIGSYPQTHALIDDWYNHALYLPVFALGFVLAGTRAPWDLLERVRWPALGLAVLGWAFLSAYFAVFTDDAAPPPVALRLFQRAVYGGEQWLAIVAVLGFARRHLMRDSPARRYLTTAIFPVYILHQTIIVVLAHALKPAKLAAPVEAALLVLATVALSFLCYELIRRVALLRPLFGLPPADAQRIIRPLLREPAPQDIN
jgi:acyltransferase-like protein